MCIFAISCASRFLLPLRNTCLGFFGPFGDVSVPVCPCLRSVLCGYVIPMSSATIFCPFLSLSLRRLLVPLYPCPLHVPQMLAVFWKEMCSLSTWSEERCGLCHQRSKKTFSRICEGNVLSQLTSLVPRYLFRSGTEREGKEAALLLTQRQFFRVEETVPPLYFLLPPFASLHLKFLAKIRTFSLSLI